MDDRNVSVPGRRGKPCCWRYRPTLEHKVEGMEIIQALRSIVATKDVEGVPVRRSGVQGSLTRRLRRRVEEPGVNLLFVR